MWLLEHSFTCLKECNFQFEEVEEFSQGSSGIVVGNDSLLKKMF